MNNIILGIAFSVFFVLIFASTILWLFNIENKREDKVHHEDKEQD